MRQAHVAALAAALALQMAGCTVGPEYVTPTVPMTDTFKEATPADYRDRRHVGAGATERPDRRGKWWQIFGDPAAQCAGGRTHRLESEPENRRRRASARRAP